MSTPSQLKGVFAATLTPFDADGVPDLPRMLGHAAWLRRAGCDGVAPLGTTGEGNSIATADRLRIIDAFAGAYSASELLIGTGACAVGDAIQLTRHAVAAGAPNVLVLPPFYYKNPSVEGLYAFFARLIDGVADARLGVYLYHFPAQAVVGIPLALVERLLKAYPDTVRGLKDSSGDWEVTQSYCEAFPGFGVFSGTESNLSKVIAAGGAGCISATVNVTAPIARLVADATGAEAAGLQEELTAARQAIQKFALIPGLKALTRRRTGDVAWDRMLPPNMPLAPGVERALFQAVDATTLAARGQSVARAAE
jgi:4-hydroxy-tetrahydrodipicolinate synthase